jgi:hypothetical protein
MMKNRVRRKERKKYGINILVTYILVNKKKGHSYSQLSTFIKYR